MCIRDRTATALETARNIGGVSFDGTANINLPGVNIAGNQDTSGTATNATNASNLNIVNQSGADFTMSVLLSNDTTGVQEVKSHSGITYNTSNSVLSVGRLSASNKIFLPDTAEIGLGNVIATPDMKLYHQTGTNYINSQNGSALHCSQNDFQVRSVNADEVMIAATANGSVKLYYDSGNWASATPKLETTTGGVAITGTITATTFGTATQNSYGTRTVGTGTPTGGNNGDIYYRY